MNHIVKADAEGIIWVIVFAFWVIAQIAGAAAQKKRQTRLPPPGEEGRQPPEEPFAELLRKMAGAQEFKVPHPEFAEAPEEVPEEKPWKWGDIEALPVIEPLRRKPPAPEPIVKPIKVPEIDIRPKMSAFRNSVPSIRLPAMNLSFRGSETSIRKAPSLGTVLNPSDKQTLRRAMLSHIIFSPPKAME